MSAIFDALPGIEVPVGAISQRLADLWIDTAASGKPAIEADDAKATQANVVLHLGLNTTDEDGAAQFRTVVEFSKRYPSRIVVLCPLVDDDPATEMRAKIYAECFLGKTKSDKRCVEFVVLSYPRRARQFLENQVSICLSADLPLYYWAHRFSVSKRLADYRYLLGRAKRVLIDSAIVPADALTIPWPNPAALRDLVYSRLLPVRQTVGQFLSGYAPARLVDGLRAVTVGHDAPRAAEGRVLRGWLERRLAACGVAAAGVQFVTAPLPAGVGGNLGVRFDYTDTKKYFRWSGDLTAGMASFEADFGDGRTTLTTRVSLLAPEAALGEAMFF
jgi:glucose-6-phosphate dehydrogenase assembly protein OpcA